MKTETKEIILNITDDDEGWYMLKDCHITNITLSRTPTGEMSISAELVAGDYVPAEVDVDFKDGKKKVMYKDYIKVRKKFKNPEDMSYEQFEDCLMVCKI